MNTSKKPFLSSLGQDRFFWAIVGALLVAFLLLQRRTALPLVASLVGLLTAVTIHEFAHAWAADRLGDPTARLMGRLTLNPLAHLDPLGTVMMVITVFTGMGIGWGKPVPVSPWRLKYGSRLGNGLVALAGPISNLALAALVALLLRAMAPWAPAGVIIFGQAIVMTNVVIAFFNLLPIPPLDGASVLIGLLSLSRGRWAWQISQFFSQMAAYGPMVLIGLILLSQFMGLSILGWLIGVPSRWVYGLLLGGS